MGKGSGISSTKLLIFCEINEIPNQSRSQTEISKITWTRIRRGWGILVRVLRSDRIWRNWYSTARQLRIGNLLDLVCLSILWNSPNLGPVPIYLDLFQKLTDFFAGMQFDSELTKIKERFRKIIFKYNRNNNNNNNDNNNNPGLSFQILKTYS